MKKKYYWIIGIVILVILILFFYPKDCGNWGTSLEAKTFSCGCFGYKFNEPLVGGGRTFCSGICLENACKCMQYQGEPPELVEVPCD